jgi:FtsP/CotA-like multicopper oxidase with cupredoxin domain
MLQMSRKRKYVVALSGLSLFIIAFFIIMYKAGSSTQRPITLTIKKIPITVHGKTAKVYQITQTDGTWGYHGVKGQYFDVIVDNQTDEPTALHWHGLVLPNQEDGVPGITQPAILPGQKYHYYFKLQQSGTYWMHSHYAFQLQQLMSAPLILQDAQQTDAHDVVMLLTDFSFKSPEVLFNELRHQKTSHAYSMNMKMSSMSQDLADVQYDAFLTNYRTLEQPQIVRVTPGETVRLRIIDGAASTNFFVKLGSLSGKLIAVDGEAINPLTQSAFNLVMGQRLDVLVTLPKGEGAYPILAQGEGTAMQTGLILATPKAVIPSIPEKTHNVAGAITLQQESQLTPIQPLSRKSVTQTLVVNLTGNMSDYVWEINGKVWPNYTPLITKEGDRVEMVFHNLTDMSHPMHLHGHVFEVTEINGKKYQGALRDTVLIPAHGTIKIQFDADNPGNWMIHCHVLYHSEGGMMTILQYAVPS